MEQALRAAGFTGVDTLGNVIYARTNSALPEFTVTENAGQWQLAFAWPLRATAAQIAAWSALHPDVAMDIFQGETRITMPATLENLRVWAARVEEMVTKCTQWRRATRQRDEGM
jgi:hypothetical protein